MVKNEKSVRTGQSSRRASGEKKNKPSGAAKRKSPASRVSPPEKITANMSVRLLAVMLGLGCLFIVLVYRLYVIADEKSPSLIKIQNSQITVERDISPPRGDILDRKGRPLAKDTPLVRVVIDPKLFHDDWCMFGSQKCHTEPNRREQKLEREKHTLEKVARLLDIGYGELTNIIRNNAARRYKVLSEELPPSNMQLVKDVGTLEPYVYMENYYRRFYSMKEATSNLLGVVNRSGSGISGLEKAYDDQLKSSKGRVLEKYAGKVGLRKESNEAAKRHVFYTEELVPAVYGRDIQLSIDSFLQYEAYKTIARDTPVFGAKWSSAIVVDVTSGEILALADYPATNPNDRQNLKFDFTVSASMAETVEPGSSIKPLVMGALLDAGLVREQEVVKTSPGYIRIDRWTVKDVKNYGDMTPAKIIQKSSNVGMVKLTKRMSGGDFSLFLNTLGFNESTGAFPGLEAIGKLGNAYESEVTKLNQSYGYGMEVTMLSLARAYTALGRKGELISLNLLKDHSPPRGHSVLTEDTTNTILRWMELVTQKQGTASKAAIEGVRIAGKTGTARARGFKKDENEVYNNIFAGLFPAEKPKYMVLVAYIGVYPPYHYAGNSAALSFKDIALDVLHYSNSQ